MHFLEAVAALQNASSDRRDVYRLGRAVEAGVVLKFIERLFEQQEFASYVGELYPVDLGHEKLSDLCVKDNFIAVRDPQEAGVADAFHLTFWMDWLVSKSKNC